MYDELIKRLKETPSIPVDAKLHNEAADAIEALITALTASNEVIAKNKPKWIPVTERLPEESGSYLIVDGRLVMEGLYEKDWVDYPWTDPGEMYMTYHPSHWMPLPQPPEGE